MTVVVGLGFCHGIACNLALTNGLAALLPIARWVVKVRIVVLCSYGGIGLGVETARTPHDCVAMRF